METEQLKEYIRHVRDLEVSCYEQELLLDKLRQQQQAVLNSYAQQQKPLLSFYSEETNPDCIQLKQLWAHKDAERSDMIFWRILLCLAVVIVLLIPLAFLYSPVFLLLGTALTWIILLIFVSRADFNRERERAQLCRQKVLEANAIVQRENQKINAYNSALYHRLQAEAASYSEPIERITRLLQETKALREEAYSKHIIFEKYISTSTDPHNGLVPITMFCEYLESGMCDTLVGPYGAYKTYEEQIRLDLIIVNLQQIQVQLSRIEQNQYMLAQELRNINFTVQSVGSDIIHEIHDSVGGGGSNNINQTLHKIEQNTAASEYYAREAARNAEYQTWMQFTKF